VSKSIVFFIGISAIVTSLIALILLLAGFLASGHIDEAAASYIFNSGLIMIPMSLGFTLGLYFLKSKKPIGNYFVIFSSIALILLLLFSAFTVFNVSQNWKLTSLIFTLTALIIAPFVWLIVYLWQLRKKTTTTS